MMTRPWRYTFLVTVAITTAIVLFILAFTRRTVLPDIAKASQIKNLVPVLVIGSGPAGLSAALYTARAQIDTLIAAGHEKGGQLVDVREIENWPGRSKTSGEKAVLDLLRQANSFGATVMPEAITKIDASVWPFAATLEDETVLRPLALIVATGRIAKRLHVPGVDEYWGKGVGTCTICDAPFHKDQVVGVVGSGDAAADHAQELAAYATKVYMFMREPGLTATGAVQEYVKNNKKIELITHATVERVDGNGTSITSVMYTDGKTGKQEKKEIQGLYFAIGYHPNSELVKSFLPTDNAGFVMMPNRTQSTQIPGIFVAGDIEDKRYGKAGVAIGKGIQAGIDAIEFLENIGFMQIKDRLKQNTYVYKEADNTAITIPSMTSLEELNRIIHSNKMVLVDFYASYCPTCKVLLPHVQKVAQELGAAVKIVKVDGSITPDILKTYQIKSIPYFIFFKEGKQVLGRPIKTTEHLRKLIKEIKP
ncbi:MAG: FAD-dependent oxidoreductase [Candidatus Babeliales bacterium]